MNLKRTAVTVVTLALFILLVACGEDAETPTPTPTATPAPSPTPTPTATPSPPSIPDIIDALRPSVVHIQTEAVQLDEMNQPVPTGGVGTGVVIDKEGRILTNSHVVAGAERILVTLSDGRGFEAELIGHDLSLDLAVLRIRAEGLIPVDMGESSELRVGDQVIAMGHALNLEGGPTVTVGWVSALNRSIDISAVITMRRLIQTDAAINPGNSGGPLVNLKGELVGVNTARIPSGGAIGFAIAIDPAKPLIDELIASGEIGRGFLGVSGITINEAVAMNFGLSVTSGVGVISVAPGSPAEEAGIQIEDIIVGVAGKSVDDSGELDDILIEYQAGTSVEVEFFRGAQRRTVSVILGERPR